MKQTYRTILAAAAFSLALTGAAAAATNFVIVLDGLQETPPNASPATGSGTAVLSDDQSTLTINYSFSGLTSAQTNAHVHNAAAGVPGGVVKNLPTPNSNVVNFVWAATDGTQPLTAAMVTEALAERLYINIHSTNFTGGEIRGQLLLEQVPVEGASWSKIKNLVAVR